MFLPSQVWSLPSVLLLGFYQADSRMPSWLQKHVSLASSLECSVVLTDILLVTASLNVMSMYHDTLLARMVNNNPSYQPLIPLSLHSRFTRAWLDKSCRYKWISRILEIIKFTELVIEMGLRRKVSQQTKWRCIMTLEVVK
jgi:Peroxisomal membrane protein (Pex16)